MGRTMLIDCISVFASTISSPNRPYCRSRQIMWTNVRQRYLLPANKLGSGRAIKSDRSIGQRATLDPRLSSSRAGCCVEGVSKWHY